jgi:galactokinase
LIAESFQNVFGSAPEVVVRAPGRVNLIGEHTDYNDGYVLPAAIDRTIAMAARRREDHIVRVHSLDYAESVEFSLDAIERDAQHRWSNYVRGVTKLFQAATHPFEGADIAFRGDVPREAGLSSSAALEVVTVACWEKLAGIKVDPVFGVKLAQRAENEFVGLPCGVMDQFASALSRANHALFLDCRDLSFRHVPLRAGVSIVVCNTGVRRELTQSEYEVRLKQCRQALAQLGTTGLAVRSLREVDLEDVESAREELGDLLYRRARHVVTENQRVLDAVAALEGGHLDRFGELMRKSHESLRDDYEVSCRELDTLVESAWGQPGVIGARMTGGGFGGCTVNLVEADAAEDFAKAVAADYKQAIQRDAEIYVCQASDGALAG